MTQTLNEKVASQEQTKSPRFVRGIASVLAIIGLITIVVGWAVTTSAAMSRTIDVASVSMLAAFALLATAGLVLYTISVRRRAYGLAALGLLFAAVAPTGFFYIGNVLCIAAALVLLATALHVRLRHKPAKSS